MVGGTVIEVIELPKKIWVNVKDTTYKDTAAIYIERNKDSERIVVGDSIWWQGKFAMWTPGTREVADVKIPRLSYSGVGRPEAQTFQSDDVFADVN